MHTQKLQLLHHWRRLTRDRDLWTDKAQDLLETNADYPSLLMALYREAQYTHSMGQVEPPSEALVAAVVAAIERCLPSTTALSLSIIIFNLAKLCRQHDGSHAEHARHLMSLCYPLLEQVGPGLSPGG